MFAIIEDGGRQYKVTPGQQLVVDLRSEGQTGDSITFDRVLLANGGSTSVIGQPLIDGASVSGEIVDPLLKGEKLEIQKIRRRKNSRRHTGHRQKHTVVQIGDLTIPGLEIVETAAEPVEEPVAEKPVTEAVAEEPATDSSEE